MSLASAQHDIHISEQALPCCPLLKVPSAWARSFGALIWNLPSKRIHCGFPSALPSLCSRSFSVTAFARSGTSSKQRLPQTLTEKIVQRYAVDLPEGKLVQSGDYINCRPQHCMTHDNTAPVASKFRSMGATRIHNAEQIVICLDHDIQNTSPSNLHKYAQIEVVSCWMGHWSSNHGRSGIRLARQYGCCLGLSCGTLWCNGMPTETYCGRP
jgi:hypothetical protein